MNFEGMDYQKLCKILKKKDLHSYQMKNLSDIYKEIDFSGKDLSDVDFSYCKLIKCKFRNCILNGARFLSSSLYRVDFTKANLKNTTFTDSNMEEVVFEYADLQNSKFTTATIKNGCFRSADLRKADLYDATFISSDLSRVLLSKTKPNSYFVETNLCKCNLSQTPLPSQHDWIRKNLEKVKDGYIAYKVFGVYNESPLAWKIDKGCIIKEVVNHNRTEECGCGINVATPKWIYNLSRATEKGGLVWRCLIKNEWLADICVPYNTDGKFRCGKIKLLDSESIYLFRKRFDNGFIGEN